jgi:diguanylate cyclase (GGDEF)-like protein
MTFMFTHQPSAPYKPKVLAVDDSPANLDILVEHLQNEQLELIPAVSGEEALYIARQSPPDLILLDVMMPGLDGYSLCRILKKDPFLSDIPVVFLTARDTQEDVEFGFALGAVDFIHKPFSPPILKARVRSHLALKRKSDLLTELACTDALTGIPNRRQFDANLEREWLRAQRSSSQLSVMMIDVDFFKRFNDSYGHGAGDKCLKAIAQAIAGELKRPGDQLARYGGEEFAVLLPETDMNEATKIAERIRQAVARLAIKHDKSSASSFVSISLGGATALPGVELNLADLLPGADAQLYLAKQAGRNCSSMCSLTTKRALKTAQISYR